MNVITKGLSLRDLAVELHWQGSHCTSGRIDTGNKVLRAVDQTHEST